MRTAVAALTKKGSQLALTIGERLNADIYIKQEYMGQSTYNKLYEIEGSFAEFARKLFSQYNALIFIMACGIVVRSIAPHLKDKKDDPAVVVLDEKGLHVVSLLSGHLGGANDLAKKVAMITGGEAVITTATDVNHVIAFDMFAKTNNCTIENINDLKYISAELVNGGQVSLKCDPEIEGFYSDQLVKYNPNVPSKAAVVITSETDIEVKADKVLVIRPRDLILGIGCKRGITEKEIETAVLDFMEKNNRSFNSLQCVATVDLKKDEAGIADFAKQYKLPLKIVSRDEIKRVENTFSRSDFVKETIGVGAVAEPCAVLAGNNTKLIVKKAVYQGITLALAREEIEYTL